MEKELKVLVTGSEGFIGKNLVEALSRRRGVTVLPFDKGMSLKTLAFLLAEADIVYHLAGVNRPEEAEDFWKVNAGLTAEIVRLLDASGRWPTVILSSSTQAVFGNPYGLSKRKAEELLFAFGRQSGAKVYVYRLPGVFGKWSRPDYNTVVATFCHNISRGLDIVIDEPEKRLDLVYIDEVVQSFISRLDMLHNDPEPPGFLEIEKVFHTSVGELALRLYEIRDIRHSLVIPDLSDPFTRRLHSTYISFLDDGALSYPLETKKDNRGSLFELLKSPHAGQVFVSKTLGGVTRGNHYHDGKVEKFWLIKGRALIRLRHIATGKLVSYEVSDEKIEVVDIPPGYTHSIENLTKEEMIVFFWASEILDPDSPDTYYCEV